jgi:hypothetical protein
VQILGTPQIKWKGAAVSSAQCPLTLNENLSGSSPQCAVVGQQISLNTDVPSGTATSTTWTVSGTAVRCWGKLTGDVCAGPTSDYAQVTPIKTDDPTIQFYWVYPGDAQHPNPLNVTYAYCTPIALLDPADVNGNCSLPATVSFNLNGVTNPSIRVDPKGIPSPDWEAACGGRPASYWLNYGPLTGPQAACGIDNGDNYGISFTALGTAPSDGKFLYVQVADLNHIDFNSTIDGPSQINTCSGLDHGFPYDGQYFPTIIGPGYNVADAPGLFLGRPGLTTAIRYFHARMYLMWQSAIPGSIPVPLASVAWRFDAEATNSNNKWEAVGIGPIGPIDKDSPASVSSKSQNNFGFPTWFLSNQLTPCPIN